MAELDLGIAVVLDATIVAEVVSTSAKAITAGAKFAYAAEVATGARLAKTNRYAIAIAQRDATYVLARNRVAVAAGGYGTNAVYGAQHAPGGSW